ncbi:MAG TPA: NmrA family NAD(P)-binding protein [Gemmatimonadaceae bacterium]|nr:NmrA family NAD(P)-binding protein [Gemmatimonadaceae bacterium]
MHVVLGATGHVGAAVADALLDRGLPVTVVTRDRRRALPFTQRGAAVAELDLRDVDGLRRLLAGARRAFLLNPPADPTGDPVADERRTARAIVQAVSGAALEKVVVQSTYGARPGEAIGDLGVLHELEEAIAALRVPASVVRGAYFMSNWDASLDDARERGRVEGFLPTDLRLPMVAPRDLGVVAARLLLDEGHRGVLHVEGPARYTPADVARAFAAALGREVTASAIPRARWRETMLAVGFSPAAADSFANMTAVTVDEPWEPPAPPERGPTSLEDHVRALFAGRSG